MLTSVRLFAILCFDQSTFDESVFYLETNIFQILVTFAKAFVYNHLFVYQMLFVYTSTLKEIVIIKLNYEREMFPMMKST